jgi:hypothetical protein
MVIECPHCGFTGEPDGKSCLACLQDTTSRQINRKAIYDRVFSLSEKANPSTVRLPVPIAIGRVVWLEMPVDYTQAEATRLVAILQRLLEFQEEDERERIAFLDEIRERRKAAKDEASPGEYVEGAST